MENAHNQLLAKLKLPGRTFQLPSRGALYHDGEVVGTEGEVHVHAMSALTEITLKNPDLLFNGKALEEVCAECVPEIKKPSQLFGRDIDALMFFLRIVTYGPTFEMTVKHTCKDAKDHSYSVDLEKLLQQMKFLDPVEAANFSVTLSNGQVVKLHPVRFEHMIKLFQLNANKPEMGMEDIKANIVFNLTNLIESVDGVTDTTQIEQWVRQITTPMQSKITSIIDRMNDWGPPRDVSLKCKDCGEEMNVELPLNPISFFTG